MLMRLPCGVAMQTPDDIELISISEEADRLLADISDVSKPPPDEAEAVSVAKPDSEKACMELVCDNLEALGIHKTEEKDILFAEAVSQLRRKGALRHSASTPSCERSRISLKSFVVCDINDKVIGRVPLASLHSKLIEWSLAVHNSEAHQVTTNPSSSTYPSGITNLLTDNSVLLLINDLTAQEQNIFATEYDKRKKYVTTGVFLALFFGNFGFHKFWLGNYAMGGPVPSFFMDLRPGHHCYY